MRVTLMLCFAVLSGSVFGGEASIVIHPDRSSREIRRTLFGANICWPMYTNNLDQESQTGGDFLALAPLPRQLGLTMLRYPGGLWSDAYRWKRGIGPVGQRKGGSPNGTDEGQMPIIGTDEYLRFCEAAGMEGIITVNYGLSQIESPEVAYQEAADWVEYCNAPNDGSNPGGGTDWAAVRAKNGHPKPYRVRYWEIGNEIYILEHPRRKWGHTDVTTYATRCVEFTKAMRAIDPTIKVGAVAHMKPDFISPNDTVIGSEKPWNRTILEIAGRHIDFLIPHVYSSGPGGRTGTLISNGVLLGEFKAQSAGEYTIKAAIGGDKFLDEWSHFRLEVDGTAVAEFDTKSKRPQPFAHKLRLTAGEHTIGIRFTNDKWIKGKGDRNLYIGGVTMHSPEGAETQVHFISDQDRLSLCTAVVENDRQRLREIRRLIRELLPEKADTFELAATEWNEGGGEVGTFSAAMHCAAKLMMMAEEGVESAHYWLLFNAVQYRRTELWFPTNGARLPRPPAFVFQIFTRHCQDRLAELEVSAPPLPPVSRRLEGWPEPGAALRVLATVNSEGNILGLVIINRDVTHSFETSVSWPGFVATGEARITCLTAKDPYDRNKGCTSMEDLRVKPTMDTTAVKPNGLKYAFPPMSMTGMTVHGRLD